MIRVPLAALALLFILVAADASAQQPPQPSFSTSPSPPPVNQAFDATFRVTAFAAAIGVWFPPEVIGDTVVVNFDFGCGFICPGGEPFYHDFHFQMPALAAGSYRVRFVSGGDPIAEFGMVVGGGPRAAVALPTWSPLAGVALFTLLLSAALRWSDPSKMEPAARRKSA